MLNDRIRELRKALDLTQQEFADRLGVKRNTIATYEIGRSTPIDAVVSLICRVFDVNEEWLRTGNGEMFKGTEEAAITRLCEELHATPLEMGIIRAYFKIDPDIRDSFIRHLIEEVQIEYRRGIPGFRTFADIAATTDDTLTVVREKEREFKKMSSLFTYPNPSD